MPTFATQNVKSFEKVPLLFYNVKHVNIRRLKSFFNVVLSSPFFNIEMLTI